jgi:uncharacterized protein (TIGR02679 family)
MNHDLDPIVHDPEFTSLWDAVHQRLGKGTDPTQIATLRVENLSRAAISELRSRLDTTRRRRNQSAVSTTGATTTIPFRDFLVAFDISPQELTYLAEQATGRVVVNRALLRQESDSLRQGLWAYAASSLPDLPKLVSRLRSAGVREDEDTVRSLITALSTAVAKLPARPPVSLPKLAHDCTGDPHYFDLDSTNGTRLVQAVAELTHRPEPTRPDRVRSMLSDVGILADRLSAIVLLHQVRVTGDGVLDRRLRESETPVAVNLLDLTLNPPTLAKYPLTVVENPSVLEAAMACGASIPLACTSGHLRGVDHALLQIAVDQNVPLRYAGDMDRDGIHVAEYVAEHYGATLVAMDSDTTAEAGTKPSNVLLSPLIDPALKSYLGLAEHAMFQEHDAILRRIFSLTNSSPNAR